MAAVVVDLARLRALAAVVDEVVDSPTTSRAALDRWFADGADTRAPSATPSVVLDRKDVPQDANLRTCGERHAPRHHVPASADFPWRLESAALTRVALAVRAAVAEHQVAA